MTEQVTMSRVELDLALEEASERGARKVLAHLGWNVNDDEARREIVRDILFLRDTRKGSRAVRMGAALALVTAATSALGTLLYLGFQTLVKTFSGTS